MMAAGILVKLMYLALAPLFVQASAGFAVSAPANTAASTPAKFDVKSGGASATGAATSAGSEQESYVGLPRARFLELIDGDFKKRDFDGNGKATRAEVEKFEKQTSLLQAQQNNRALFIRIDKDRNGMVSAAEFADLIPPVNFVDVSKIMQKFDVNRDQIITLIEYRSAALSNFDTLDVDKDGVLTKKEQQAMTSPIPDVEKGR